MMQLLGFFLTLIPLALMAQVIAPSAYIEFDKTRSKAIIFVHGVTGNAKDTWTNDSTKAYWPALVRRDSRFEDTNVWVFSYYSPIVNGAQNIDEIARKLGDELRAQNILEKHQTISFVGHSMGGLIVRQYLVQSLLPPSKVGMLYFFGTPSLGADLAGVVDAISVNPQFENLRPFTRETDVAAYANRWLDTSEVPTARYPLQILSFCAYETLGVFSGRRIVHEASASYLCNMRPRGSLANHVGMVKPRNDTDEPHIYLISAYSFARTKVAKLLTTTGALSLHTMDKPAIDPGSIELRTASVGSGPITVGCNSSREFTETIRASLTSEEQVVGVRPSFISSSNLKSRDTAYSFTPQGEISFSFKVQGPDSNRVRPCQVGGLATLSVDYLVKSSK